MQEKEKKKADKPVPRPCVCKKEPVIVRMRGKKMLSCPNPLKCKGNLRSAWFKDIDAAVVDWNNNVWAFRTGK